MALHHDTHEAHHGEHEHHWETSWAPMAISFGVLFLVPLAFALFVVYHMPLAAIASAGIGAPLVLAGIAKWIGEGSVESDMDLPGDGLSPIGIGTFIAGEILIFLGLFAAYWTMRLSTDAESWPPAGTPEIGMVLPLIMTVVLVASSMTYHRAEHHYEADNKSGFIFWLIVSIVIGCGFLGCTFYEYGHLIHNGFVPGTNQYSAAFFSLTGFHASHVVVGLVSFIAILIAAMFGTAHKNLVKTAGIYWHFVDIVWFFVASQVYYW
jgi:cytochrome c oxidase subunit III